MPRRPNSMQMLEINLYIDEIKKLNLMLSTFASDDHLSASDRRAKAKINRALESTLNTLRTMVSNFEYVPLRAMWVLL